MCVCVCVCVCECVCVSPMSCFVCVSVYRVYLAQTRGVSGLFTSVVQLRSQRDQRSLLRAKSVCLDNARSLHFGEQLSFTGSSGGVDLNHTRTHV